jgi:hypothetical protein
MTDIVSKGGQATLDRISNSLDLLVRLRLRDVQHGRSKTEMVELLGGMCGSAAEIARLLDLPTSTVSPILSRARKQKGKK